MISELKEYFLGGIDRFYSNDKKVNMSELELAVNFGFDKLVNYENIDSGKSLSYNYDITSWLDNPEFSGPNKIAVFLKLIIFFFKSEKLS